jgi:hypothetical protein
MHTLNASEKIYDKKISCNYNQCNCNLHAITTWYPCHTNLIYQPIFKIIPEVININIKYYDNIINWLINK